MSDRLSAFGLVVRNLLWVALLPGVAAGLVPWLLFGTSRAAFDPRQPAQWLGLLGLLAGIALLGACVVAFARRGRGTLSPADPPTRLVVDGLYRFVRNPMYLAVSLVLLGEAACLRSRSLLLYWAVWFAVVHSFVVLYEEPALRRRFGAEYERYCGRVARWWPRPAR